MSALDAEIQRREELLRNCDAPAESSPAAAPENEELTWLRLLEVAVREHKTLGIALALAELDRIRGGK